MKKIFLSALIYLLLVCIIRFIIIPEKYIYGHHHEYKFLEFLLIVVVIPASVGLFYIAKTANKNKAIGVSILFIAFGFFGLLLSTFIEKGVVYYQIDNYGKTIIGKVNYTYLQRAGSRSSGKIQYHFIVSFNVKDSSFYSLPGFTDDEKYRIGDPITVKYLERNPFLNKIYYEEE
ncbi:MAG: hypothetical protein JNM51_16065 [Bacteroidia bacterium]|nr:hypothetical protein [Bacteroidia bacterium]